MVNRLLDCKQIDVDVQNKVSGMLIALHPISHLQCSSRFVFSCVFLIKILLTVKNVERIYRTDLCFSGWTFECGQSTAGL